MTNLMHLYTIAYNKLKYANDKEILALAVDSVDKEQLRNLYNQSVNSSIDDYILAKIRFIK